MRRNTRTARHAARSSSASSTLCGLTSRSDVARRAHRARGLSDVREQLTPYLGIADLPDDSIGEIVMDVDDHEDQDRGGLARLFAEDVADDAHRAQWHYARDKHAH